MRVSPYIIVAFGGAIGSALRLWLGHYISLQQAALPTPLRAFPFGILAVNLLGSLAIGLFAGAFLSRLGNSEQGTVELMRQFLVLGVLGGFTTFSSFSLDMLTLLRSGTVLQAFMYVSAQVIGGLVLVAFGFFLGRAWLS